ncbi:MAG: hypothetical protein ACLP8A_14025 [Methylovirgula sp.]
MRFAISVAAGMAAVGLFVAAPAMAQNPVGEVLGTAAAIAEAPFVFGGHNYCWYPDGWHGPGWYWCGYGARRGYGWGGGEGFHGWHHGGHGGPHGHGGDHHGGDHGGHDHH